ncbi:MAG: RNA methyltransferase [Acidimicrobiia bacterium]|nr:RNA methyltransferase [Acidimicrobiia bacterium]
MAAAKLQDRKARIDAGRTLLEGPHLLQAALDAGVAVDVIFALEDTELAATDVEVLRVAPQVLAKLASTEHPRGPVAVFQPRPLAPGDGHALVLWALADPGNVGTLIRTAAAFALDVVTVRGTADVWSPKVLRAAAGAHFTVGFDETETVADLKDAGYRVIASVASGGAWPDEIQVRGQSALLIGNEAHGLPAEVSADADVRVSIPMPGGTESFNAGVAGSILAYTLFGS